MKKALSFVLILTMLASMLLATIPAFAVSTVPSGYTEIKTAEQFYNMASGGKYYLSSDITITKNTGMQNGSFDGGNHTITLGSGANSVFGWFGNGEMQVSNLTIEGKITWDSAQSGYPTHVGPLVMHGGNGFKVNNVVSSVDIDINFDASYTGNGNYFGGIVSKAEGNTSITNSTYNGTVTITGNKMSRSFGAIVGELCYGVNTVSGCKNEGSITASGSANSDKTGIGGIVGRACEDATVENCVNDGVIASSVPLTNVGGIVGFSQNAALTVSGCTNKKALSGRSISANNMGVGGILGSSHNDSNANRKVTIVDCTNSGKLTVDPNSGATYVGGIAGRLHKPGFIDILDCTNTGIVDVPTQVVSEYGGASGIVGGFTTPHNGFEGEWNIKNCTNSASITGNASTGGIVGCALQVNAGIDMLVANCVNSGAVTSKGMWAGGIIGSFGLANSATNDFDSLTVRGCVNSGAVTAKWEAAGIVANMNSAAGTTRIADCANSGAIVTNDTAATWKTSGIVFFGKNTVSVEGCLNTGTLGAGGGAIVPIRSGQEIAKLTTSKNTYSNSGTFAGGTQVSTSDANSTLSTMQASAQKPDYVELKATIAEADTKVSTDYTSSSWSNMQSALTSARAALSSTKQLTVDQSAASLSAAIAGLVMADLDFSQLEAKIKSAEALDQNKFSVVSRFKLNDAIAEAKKSLSATTQAAVNEAINALSSVISSLKAGPASAVDYCELKYWIEDAESLSEDDYTEKSFKAMTEKLTLAKAAEKETNQKKVNAASDALMKAIKALVLAPVKEQEPSKEQDDQAPNDSIEATEPIETGAPETNAPTDAVEESGGCNSAISTSAVVLTLALIGATLKFRKKED